VTFFLHRLKAARGAVGDSAHTKHGPDNHQQAAGKFSDFGPLPCGIDRYGNPFLSGETPGLNLGRLSDSARGSWQPRFHHLTHPRPAPRVKQSRHLFHASQWPIMSEISLVLAIVRLATEERLAVGPARVRFRRKRLRAVELFKTRFTTVPTLNEFSTHPLPRLGQ
jgi:hypothetical protein